MTNHAPGYAGFIPSVITFSNAVEHSKGLYARDTFLK